MATNTTSSNDVYEVAQRYFPSMLMTITSIDPCMTRFWEFQSLITKPLELVLSVVLIWRLIGWPCLLGVLTIVVAQLSNVLIARILLQREGMRRAATDSKLQKVTEYVRALRHLRWYGWQECWQEKILQARQHELSLRVTTSLLGILITFTNNLASGMFPVAAFYAYTVMAGRPLRVDIAFPALQLFKMLEGALSEIPSLITILLNARIAVDRIEDFMGEPNKVNITASERGANLELKLKAASFAWPGTDRIVLHEISIAFPVGLTVITGKVGAGKTALLQALMGELDNLAGSVIQTHEIIGYCSQRPWLQSASIRDNILFYSPFDEHRYNRIVEACALTPDLACLKDGDLSQIGEEGVGLSGGQKARVALARTLYSSANLLLLDDPLSALDQQTAAIIVRRCFGSSLLEGKKVILVTHRTECDGIAQQLVEMSEGRARVLNEIQNTDSNTLSTARSADPTNNEGEKPDKPQEADQFIEEEHRAHGGVKGMIYWHYVKAGKIKWWAVLISILALYRLVTVGETWYIKFWSEAFERGESGSQVKQGPFDGLPPPGNDVTPWLMGFFCIAAIRSCMFLISRSFMLLIIYSTARSMFRDVLQKVSHSPFRFYDITPIGRLMNRLTSDIATVEWVSYI